MILFQRMRQSPQVGIRTITGCSASKNQSFSRQKVMYSPIVRRYFIKFVEALAGIFCFREVCTLGYDAIVQILDFLDSVRIRGKRHLELQVLHHVHIPDEHLQLQHSQQFTGEG